MSSGAGADDCYIPSLWYYDLLLFTLEKDPQRTSRSLLDPHLGEENVDTVYLYVLPVFPWVSSGYSGVPLAPKKKKKHTDRLM